VIPSEELRGIAAEDTYGHIKLEFRPGSMKGRLARYRRPLSELPQAIT
jgi:hypothetical protein